MIFATTPSQTVGPYFAIGLPFDEGKFVVPEGTPGAITIRGTVYDGAGIAVPDNLIETWQADPDGRFADLHGYGGVSELPGFRGFARVGFEVGDGTFEILTVKPGRVPDLTGKPQAPHIDVSVFARGTLHRYVTRIYFADEADGQRGRPAADARSGRASRRRCWPSRAPMATSSTSTSRARARPSFSPSEARPR